MMRPYLIDRIEAAALVVGFFMIGFLVGLGLAMEQLQ